MHRTDEWKVSVYAIFVHSLMLDLDEWAVKQRPVG